MSQLQTQPNTNSQDPVSFAAMKSDLAETAARVADTARTSVDAGRRDLAPVGAEVKNLVSDVETILKNSAHLTAEQLADIRAKLEGQFSRAKEAAQQAELAVKEKAGQAANATNRYVHDEPWQAIGIAAAVGFAAGVLVMLSRRPE